MTKAWLGLALLASVLFACSDNKTPPDGGKDQGIPDHVAWEKGIPGDKGPAGETGAGDTGVGDKSTVDLPPVGDGGETVEYSVLLSGSQEMPPVESDGTGDATVLVDPAQAQIVVQLNVSDVTGLTAVHIHVGNVGQTGPVIFTLATAAFTNPLIKVLRPTDLTLQPSQGVNNFADAMNAIKAGKAYINVHTTTNPDGEIRGALGPQTLKVLLSGGQEIPAVTTSASGTATVEIDGALSQVAVTLDGSNLVGMTGAYIRLGKPGRIGPAILTVSGQPFTTPLTKTLTETEFTASPVDGIDEFPDAVNAILSGHAYLEVQTAVHAEGEIRGHIGAALLSVASLRGDQEVPAVTSTATGTGTLTMNGQQDELIATLSTTSLANITGAQIHVGAPGANGPVIFPLATQAFTSPLKKTLKTADLTAQPGSGVANFADAVKAILSGKTFFNVRSTAHSAGEVRGHLGPVALKATLTGANEVPAVTTVGSGTAVLALTATQDEFTATVNVSNMTGLSGAYLHAGATGATGPVIFTLASQTFGSPLNVRLNEDGLSAQGDIQDFTDAVNAMLTGKIYVNVNTTANPSGEIRGQLAP